MKKVLFSLLILLGAALGARAQMPEGKIVDLTHAFDKRTIYWPTEDGFKLKRGFKGYTKQGYYYYANSFTTAEHGGTHIDAPVHFYKGRRTVDRIPLKQLMGEAVMIDVSSKCLQNPDYEIQIKDIQAWEKEHGRVPRKSIVLFRTGYGKFWPKYWKYMGTREKGSKAVSKLHFPGLHHTAARWLVKKRWIKAVGVDTASIDRGQSKNFRTHVALFKGNVPVFENLASLHTLPPRGLTVIALPMNIRGGSGGPLRIVAIVGKEKKKSGLSGLFGGSEPTKKESKKPKKKKGKK